MTCAIPLISIVIGSRLLRHAASQPRPRHLSAADRFRFGARLGFVLRRHRIPAPQLRCTDCAYRTLHDCRQFYFDVRDESISFKEFLLLIFHFYWPGFSKLPPKNARASRPAEHSTSENGEFSAM